MDYKEQGWWEFQPKEQEICRNRFLFKRRQPSNNGQIADLMGRVA
jgi:hypothetical protein